MAWALQRAGLPSAGCWYGSARTAHYVAVPVRQCVIALLASDNCTLTKTAEPRTCLMPLGCHGRRLLPP